MVVVVADTGPLNYLVLIGCIEVMPSLFGTVFVPSAVLGELRQPGAPQSVRAWAAPPPPWLVERPVTPVPPASDDLGPGETEAIHLARELAADLMVMDDRLGTVAAKAQGLAVIGTLGLLGRAARRDLVDLPVAIARLRATNFRARPQMFEDLLSEHRAGVPPRGRP